jgi:hypothetical protein
MIVYALTSRHVQETVISSAHAKRRRAAVREIVNVEPQLAADVFVAEIEPEDPSTN